MPETNEEMERTATEFYGLSAFPKVIGAIDCTHVPIKSPGKYLTRSSLIKLAKAFLGLFK